MVLVYSYFRIENWWPVIFPCSVCLFLCQLPPSCKLGLKAQMWTMLVTFRVSRAETALWMLKWENFSLWHWNHSGNIGNLMFRQLIKFWDAWEVVLSCCAQWAWATGWDWKWNECEHLISIVFQWTDFPLTLLLDMFPTPASCAAALSETAKTQAKSLSLLGTVRVYTHLPFAAFVIRQCFHLL